MLFLLLFLLWTVTNAQNNENKKIIKCRSGFLASSRVQEIPPERINDGYCDCPHDGGVDEPHTEACSGASMGGWAGINTLHSNNKMVACPHQPSLILPVSRIHDGICDCCSGADESVLKKCPDVCEEVLREERERRRVLEDNFKIGWTKRQEALREFQNVVQETTAKLEQLQKQHAGIQRTLDQVEVELATLKRNALQERVTLVQTTLLKDTTTITSSLLEPLSNQQLLKVIVQTCQVAGEIMDENSSFKTCIPLRLAGLDVAGILWQDEDLAQGTVDEWQRFETRDSNEWADAMDRMLAGQDNWWSSSSNTNTKHRHARRRLQQQQDDEDDWEDEDEEYNDHHHHYGDDDEYDFEEDDDYDYDGTPPETTTTTRQPERNEDIATEIQKQAFYATRVAFLNRASELIAKIDEMMKKDESEDDGEGENKEDKSSNSIDPMAFQMVRSNLRRRQEAIQRGLDCAVSAHILAKTIEDNRQDLLALAAGTLHHSNIRALDVWQIVASLQLPEYDPKSCASSLCPPTQQEHGGVLYPPGPIVEAARKFCQTVDTDNSCSNNNDDIPTSIPDNYYGYVVVQARDSNDPLSRSFAPLDNYNTDRTQLSQLNSRKDELQDKQRALADEIHQLEEQMGGRDHAKFGHDGELYSIRDSCSAVQEGKYQYEVCLFGRATQKEDGSSETFLGKWNTMKYAPETGLRIMEWTKGTKCWNGPQRSATVIVTCGPDATKVLSAEEPDTCRYVLEMESYIACDETYKQRYGL